MGVRNLDAPSQIDKPSAHFVTQDRAHTFGGFTVCCCDVGQFTTIRVGGWPR